MKASRHALVCLLTASFATALATPLNAQFWEKKDWRDWSKQECEKMLKDSPWSRRFVSAVFQEGAATVADINNKMRGETRAELEYIVQLRSALPVRQAYIRLAMIDNKYDKMPADQKKQFDESAEAFLNQDFSNRVVAHIIYTTNLQEIARFLAQYWQQSSEQTMPTSGDLIGPKGQRVRPARYIAPVGGNPELELIYAKQMEGAELVSSTDRSFSIELPDGPAIVISAPQGARSDVRMTRTGAGDQTTEPRVLIQFDPRKMTFKGKLEY